MRLLVTGKSRSGKSTALHRLVRTALLAVWSHILLADGKSIEIITYRSDTQRVYGEDEPAAFAQALTATADRLTLRYQQLGERGLVKALDSDPRELIIIDEVQEFTRHPKHGKAVRDALTRIFEKSAALGDLVIVASQRATNAVPPAVRVNANVQLRMLGLGYFQLAADGSPTRQGRVDPAAPLAGAATLTPTALPDPLGAHKLERTPTPVTRYEGAPGSGKTYALHNHPNGTTSRHIYIDVQQHSHKSLLVACLTASGAIPPDGAPLAELAEAAALAIQSEPTLLLLDNVDACSAKMHGSLHKLLDAASVAAISLAPPANDDPERDPFAALRRRATLVTLQPLPQESATQLVRQVAPSIDAASELAVVRRAAGNPKAVVAYSERIVTHGADERHQIEAVKQPSRWLNLVLLFALLVGVIMVQRHISSDIAGAVLTGVVMILIWFIRPRFREATRA